MNPRNTKELSRFLQHISHPWVFFTPPSWGTACKRVRLKARLWISFLFVLERNLIFVKSVPIRKRRDKQILGIQIATIYMHQHYIAFFLFLFTTPVLWLQVLPPPQSLSFSYLEKFRCPYFLCKRNFSASHMAQCSRLQLLQTARVLGACNVNVSYYHNTKFIYYLSDVHPLFYSNFYSPLFVKFFVLAKCCCDV